ncbi:D-isomer specific 2-hydroxyacid dehydrogenase [Syncephalis pseudoplumigaleata]|uniref:DNA polymerase epsilon catalytic subunit n=1 Tax=Syncephalis pseudoplumigaleata TaxID=1712513 RepID=A0A4P9YYQ0_9FUNG|nr:D-isomer specific 2-hydroxyacid dehydrogenase [Syncephalis pseudoplumigaleata]|eukprot:RKP25293.1 D-isomer specific 2-hydroxyacid dehydrogenase [Syncephalis pseudoplumigaleata]
MRPGSYLINASRGTVVDIPALAEALRSGHLGGAAVDVYPSEPFKNGPGFATELIGCPNTILTPHIGRCQSPAMQQHVNIDLCRDPYTTTAGTGADAIVEWRCRSCQHPLDRAMLEEQLIQLVERRVRAYQLQDVRCRRCRWIKENHMAPTCTHCAGAFELAGQLTRETLVQQLRIFGRLAHLQQLPRLADAVGWYGASVGM